MKAIVNVRFSKKKLKRPQQQQLLRLSTSVGFPKLHERILFSSSRLISLLYNTHTHTHLLALCDTTLRSSARVVSSVLYDSTGLHSFLRLRRRHYDTLVTQQRAAPLASIIITAITSDLTTRPGPTFSKL